MAAQKTVIVTGASRGIGHATALRFHANGWRVITVSREPPPGQCPWSRGPSHILLDLSDLDSVAAFATARWATAREALMPVAIAASSLPLIALAPISRAWFGVENPLARVFIVTLMVFFPVMVNTVRGLTSVELAALELMRSYAAGDVDTVGIGAQVMYLKSALDKLKIAYEQFGGTRENAAYGWVRADD